MAINRLLEKRRLSPERVATLNRAFVIVLAELRLVNRPDAITDVVAEKVIEAGATSDGDPEAIAKEAIRRLGLARNFGT